MKTVSHAVLSPLTDSTRISGPGLRVLELLLTVAITGLVLALRGFGG